MSIPLKTNDPAYWMKDAPFHSTPVIFKGSCYICRDPEFAEIGMPLCQPCCKCNGHVPADDVKCDDCGWTCDEECYSKHGKIEHPPIDVCTCATPCCEVDIGIGIMTCGGQHCPTHGEKSNGN